MNSKSLDNYKL